MLSLKQKLDRCAGLIGTKDIDARTTEFLQNMVNRVLCAGGSTKVLSERQVEWIEDIHKRHFA